MLAALQFIFCAVTLGYTTPKWLGLNSAHYMSLSKFQIPASHRHKTTPGYCHAGNIRRLCEKVGRAYVPHIHNKILH